MLSKNLVIRCHFIAEWSLCVSEESYVERYAVLVARRALGQDGGTAGWAVRVHREAVYYVLKVTVKTGK